MAKQPEDPRLWTPGPGPEVEEDVAAEIWREFEVEMRLCRNVEQAAYDAVIPSSGRPPEQSGDGDISSDEILLLEFGRSTQAFRACLNLISMGFASQASMLNRAPFEAMIRWFLPLVVRPKIVDQNLRPHPKEGAEDESGENDDVDMRHRQPGT